MTGGFCWFCIVSSIDLIWLAMFITGLVLLMGAIVIPESLEVPCRWWMTLARWQGWLVMTVLLTVLYFTLITPIGWILRWRHGSHPFHEWNDATADIVDVPGWQALPLQRVLAVNSSSARWRSAPRLLSTFGFFFEQRHYLVLPVLMILLAIGLLLFFVQGSVLAPFIYTIF